MSLDVALFVQKPAEVYSANIMHNLGAMAKEAGIYMHLWRPEEIGLTKAGELIEPLRAGLELMKADPARFEKHNSPNGWGFTRISCRSWRSTWLPAKRTQERRSGYHADANADVTGLAPEGD